MDKDAPNAELERKTYADHNRNLRHAIPIGNARRTRQADSEEIARLSLSLQGLKMTIPIARRTITASDLSLDGFDDASMTGIL